MSFQMNLKLQLMGFLLMEVGWSLLRLESATGGRSVVKALSRFLWGPLRHLPLRLS